jgi:hypothetical protein
MSMMTSAGLAGVQELPNEILVRVFDLASEEYGVGECVVLGRGVFAVAMVCQRWRKVCKSHVNIAVLQVHVRGERWEQRMQATAAVAGMFRSAAVSLCVWTPHLRLVLDHPAMIHVAAFGAAHPDQETCEYALHALVRLKLPALRGIAVKCRPRSYESLSGAGTAAGLASILDPLGRAYPKLARLTIGVYLLDVEVDADACLRSLAAMPRLTYVNIGDGVGYSDEAVASLVVSNPLIRMKSILRLRSVSPKTLAALGAVHGSKSEVLDLANLEFSELTEAELASCVRAFKRASTLVASKKFLVPEVVRALIEAAPRLKHVTMVGPSARYDLWEGYGLMIPFFTRCKLLTKVSFKRCMGLSDLHLSALCQHAPLLEALHVNDCQGTTAAGTAAAIEMMPHPETLADLRLKKCYRTLDEPMQTISRAAPKVRTAYLSSMVDITPDALACVITNWAALTRLHVCRAYVFGDRCVEALTGAVQLEHLALSENQLITNVGGKLIMQRFPRLLTLAMDFCGDITDAAFDVINCKDLTTLRLVGFNRVSSDAAYRVATNCTKIARLVLYGTSVDESGIRHMCNLLPCLRWVEWPIETEEIRDSLATAYPHVRFR